ncbi:MAG: hypothetical protein B7Z60_01090 [Ferrovum sp. 37-45-19]|uniref:conjugal transfer protein TrbD n=1 Tax=Ferrovum sp. JA12 TaxID=1356299 RepID=UPI0007034046|nr:conjugal transfer protein TrbD [Ferrovum sp. JA12]OYV79949.1 MAG: hypothetical protein B7Z65_04380 [Ferrovum sp. 21-44-67]OYV95574.1 MAG: hypothetical protein B7Z60_01090 [Ferrovum sp. 37-45-19]OZB31613.1 MAG: hypothetical protein B7X47_10280 [Ferrovum sp. 34-44-207]HQT81864.1 conjugal transfer protein TrbD [Ferrovaceae bacterium]KRH78264.1 type IV secretory pathway, VirB3-like protein [Ferrovum sp. JA12]
MRESEQPYQSIPLYRALNRPLLIMGGERHLSLMLMIICGIFIVSLPHFWSLIIGIILWVTGQTLISEAARHDPQLSRITLRHLRYQKHYLAHTDPFSYTSRWL